ncbi:MAG: DUF222 domain-containing protein [Kibdelosporangium sp.]
MTQTQSDAEAISMVLLAHAMQAYWQAVEVRNLAKFAEYRPPDRSGIKLADGAPEEIAAALSLSIPVATNRILEAEYLVRCLPATVDALEDGVIDMSRTRATVQIVRQLSTEDARRVETAVLKQGRHTSYKEYRRALRRQASKVDPEGAERRRQENRKRRDVITQKMDDCSSRLIATLSAHEAEAAYSVLDHMAYKEKTPDDTRTLAERRADVLLDLVLGKEKERVQVNLNVSVPLTTLIGLNRQPGELSEYGPITAEYCRELARDASLRRIVTDDFGHLLDASPTKYGPICLEDHVRLRDRSCRQPGCTVPARRCEVDHSASAGPGGRTGECGCQLLCKRHRKMRERARGWETSQPQPGRLFFVTPTGIVHQVRAETYEEPAA